MVCKDFSFVYVIYPKTNQFVSLIIDALNNSAYINLGHVTIGGSICMEMLTKSGWRPTNDIEVEEKIIFLYQNKKFSYLGQENPTRTPVLGNLIRNGLSGTVDCWHCLMTLLFMTSQRIPLHYPRRHRRFQWR